MKVARLSLTTSTLPEGSGCSHEELVTFVASYACDMRLSWLLELREVFKGGTSGSGEKTNDKKPKAQHNHRAFCVYKWLTKRCSCSPYPLKIRRTGRDGRCEPWRRLALTGSSRQRG